MRQSTIDLPKTPQTKEILRKLSVFMILPNETPIFATVQNTDSLAENPFYKNARVGDKVLIFKNAQKALLYRPSTDKIIDFTTIALKVDASNPAKQTTKPIAKPTSREKPTTTPTPNKISTEKQQTTEQEPFTLALYNGTQTAKLTNLVEANLKEKTALEFKVVKKDNTKKDYDEILVVDLTNNKENQAEYIAEILGGRVSKLPDKEVKPKADILIIIGTAYIKNP